MRHLRTLLPLALFALGVTAPGCGSADETESAAPVAPAQGSSSVFRYDPGGSEFFATPWPSNHRLLGDGTVDLAGFPGTDFGFLGAVRAAVEGHVAGFSTMQVGYFALTADPGDAALLAPSATLAAGAAVQLVSVDAGSCGEPVPVEMRISRSPDTYLPENVLEIAPVPGFVLRQGGEYAFVVRTGFGAQAGVSATRPAAWDAALSDDASADPVAESLAPLRACAESGALSLDDIAIATVFRVQDVIAEARALREAVADPDVSPAPVLKGWAEDAAYSASGHIAYTATYETPIFQQGVSPYTKDGDGDIVFGADGMPVVQRWETVPMIVLVPTTGAGPYPVMLWIDGTGWDQWGHVWQSVTQDLLAEGFAIASYMPQFHGDRASPDSNPEMHTYNFQNPAAGRNVLRQQLADTSYFVRVLREAVPNVAGAPSLDTSQLVFAGQSQGAQNGALSAAVEPEIGTFVLNGLASYLTITVLERKDTVDFEALLKVVAGVQGDLDRFHPVLALLQLGADSVDPHNYASHWKGSEGKPSGSHLFVLNGYADFTTHHEGIEAVTIAGDLAPIAPAGWDVDPFGVWARAAEPLPISGNREATDGSALTLATYLDAETDHFTIYDVPAERARAVAFLVDARGGGVPTLAP